MAVKKVKRIVDGKEKQVWVYDIWLGGRRVRTPRGQYFLTRADCEAAANAVRTDFQRDRYEFPVDARRVTVRSAFEACRQRMMRARRHPAVLRRLNLIEKLFSRIAGRDTPLSDITSDHLQRYVALRDAGGVRSVRRSTISSEITQLRGVFRLAKATESTLRHWQLPEIPEGIGPALPRARIITEDEEVAILTALRTPAGRPKSHIAARLIVADAFEVALGTGMRKDEILSLTKADVHFDRSPGYPFGWINVRATKTGSRIHMQTDDRAVPMNRRIAAILRARAESAEGEFLFPSIFTGKKIQVFGEAFTTACRKAGVPYGRDKGIIWHDTRRTAASRMMQRGADLKTVMEILGHRSARTALGYIHATAATRSQAVQLLEPPESRVQLESTRMGKSAQIGNDLSKFVQPPKDEENTRDTGT